MSDLNRSGIERDGKFLSTKPDRIQFGVVSMLDIHRINNMYSA